MASRSFFIQRPADAQRHIDLLAKGLKKIAIAGWVGGAACTTLAALVSHFLVTRSTQPNPIPGFQEISGITFVTWFMALALIVFSTLYYVAGWGLLHQTKWARFTAAGVFLAKVSLCAWLGRGSFSAMFVFLLIAGWDIYGLWVLLSNETGRLFSSPQPTQALSYPSTTQAPQR